MDAFYIFIWIQVTARCHLLPLWATLVLFHKTCMLAINSHSLFGSVFISPSFLKDTFIVYKLLGWQGCLFSLSTLSMPFYFLLASSVSYVKSAVNFIVLSWSDASFLSCYFQDFLWFCFSTVLLWLTKGACVLPLLGFGLNV